MAALLRPSSTGENTLQPSRGLAILGAKPLANKVPRQVLINSCTGTIEVCTASSNATPLAIAEIVMHFLSKCREIIQQNLSATSIDPVDWGLCTPAQTSEGCKSC